MKKLIIKKIVGSTSDENEYVITFNGGRAIITRDFEDNSGWLEVLVLKGKVISVLDTKFQDFENDHIMQLMEVSASFENMEEWKNGDGSIAKFDYNTDFQGLGWREVARNMKNDGYFLEEGTVEFARYKEKEAVDAEDYTEAAHWRDEIITLKNK